MPKFSANNLLIFLLFASIFALVFAYISQFVFDYQPCILCLHQRKPFFAIIALVLSSFLFKQNKKHSKIILFLCAILLLINCAVAFYHVGVEQKIFRGPTTCSSEDLNDIQDLENLKAALLETKAIRCDEPQFFLLNLSMAAWNFIYCGFLLLVVSAMLVRRPSNSS